MPYPRAHYAVLVVIGVIALGFWPSYFSVWGSVPWQFHAHGVAASVWVLMVAGRAGPRIIASSRCTARSARPACSSSRS